MNSSGYFIAILSTFWCSQFLNNLVDINTKIEQIFFALSDLMNSSVYKYSKHYFEELIS
jgi:hypothetical protein